MAYYKRKYQKGKETPDPTGTTQGELTPGDTVPNPAQQALEEAGGPNMSAEQQMMMSQQQDQNLMRSQIINMTEQELARRNAMRQHAIQEQLNLLKIKNQMLEQQNNLLQTKIQKDDMINKARTIPSNLQKAMTSPKKKGGSNSSKKRKKVIILGSNGSVATTGGGGGQMRRGGSCGLPGGRHDMKRRGR